jgi:D-ribose pyranose/furanose isomerase RbsD
MEYWVCELEFSAAIPQYSLNPILHRPILDHMRYRLLCLVGSLLVMSTVSSLAQPDWQSKLRQELPLLGHRNWIVVADSAYPLQTAPGIETLYVDADQLEVLEAVLAELAKTTHVKPIIYTDAELKHVAEKRAPGIAAYRKGLDKLFANRPVQSLPHEQIIARLDEAGKTFKVLLIKTKLTLPYTSVFLQLDCAYWNAESEKELRAAMNATGK